MAIAAADVKKLRDRTGAGMMDAKRALEEADGNFEKAIDVLRVRGAAKAATRGAERDATAGLVVAQGSALVEINSETDFVAKNDQFIALAERIAAAAHDAKVSDATELGQIRLDDGKTVEEAIQDLAVVIGEKLQLGRAASFEGTTATYLHRRASDLPPAVGVLLEYSGEDAATARAAAMQIAAMRPIYVSRDDIPAEVVAKEREIAEATAREEGKPEQALPKIVEGRLNGFFKDVALLEQPSVTDSKRSVRDVLDAAGIRVTRFARFEIGR
jgi:elongation factor Ts